MKIWRRHSFAEKKGTAVGAHSRDLSGRRRALFLICALNEIANYKEETVDHCQNLSLIKIAECVELRWSATRRSYSALSRFAQVRLHYAHGILRSLN